MKLSINSDFTSLPRAARLVPAAQAGAGGAADSVALAHDERQVRRKVLRTAAGMQIYVDLAEAATLNEGDRLELEDGRQVAVTAAPEPLMEVAGLDAVHLMELAWHIGGRHAAVQVEAHRLLTERDDALRHRLAELGAHLDDVVEPFRPLPAAQAHDHHHHHHHEHHGHHHGGDGEPDAHGRLPGDPHYGHNHA